MSFAEVLGQDAAVEMLRRTLKAGRLGSGYLFFGPGGVGKDLCARAFGRAVLCPTSARSGEACGECPSCIRSLAGSHPGFLELSREEGRKQILIQQVLELGERLSLRPMEGERSFVLLEDVERTGIEAFNALLKTLEEPPPGATLVLTTSARDAIPETILSRCQGVRFRPLAAPLVRRILESRTETPPEDVDRLVELSGGSPGRALRLLEMGYPGREAEIREVLLGGAGDPVATAERLLAALGGTGGGEGRDRAREALSLLVSEVRERFLVHPGARDPDRAALALAALARAGAALDRNGTADIVLTGVLVEILPLLRAGNTYGGG